MTHFVPSSSPQPAPEADLDLSDAQQVADIFNWAAAWRPSNLRQGALISLPDSGRLVMTGDLHDHGVNLQRIIKFASLHENPNHHLILHEVIHGPNRVNGRDMSVRTLARIAAIKLKYPDQVHMLLANHDLAQCNGEGILKGGTNVVEAFDRGIEFIYDNQTRIVRNAMNRFLASLPLAVRCANGVFCSHSLPSPRQVDAFDPNVIHRELTAQDLAAGGHAHRMVWGRRHTQEVATVLGRLWNVSLFLMGHQPAPSGYHTEGDSMLVLASDHDHGMVLPINLAQTYSRDTIIERLIPLASVTL